MRFSKKLFAVTFAASFSLPIFSQVNKGFNTTSKTITPSNSKTLIAQNPDADDSGTDADDSGTLKISVTGTRTPREVKDVPATVNVIDQDEITNRGVTELRDLFKYDAGIDLKSESDGWNNYGQGDVSIRGFSGNRILMQRDSIRLPAVYKFGSSYTIYRSEMVDFNALKGTEILKGSASSLYGSDALGGVVTFQSLYPEDLLEDGETTYYESINNYNSVNTGLSNSLRFAGRDDDSGLEGVFVITRSNANENNVKAEPKYINDFESKGLSFYTNLVKNVDDYSRFNFIVENTQKESDTILSDNNLSRFYSSSSEDRNVDRTLISANYEYDNAESDNFFDYSKFGIYYQTAYSEDDSELTRNPGFDPMKNPLYDGENPDEAEYGVVFFGSRKSINDYDLEDDSFGANVQFRNDVVDKETNHRITYGIDYSKTSNERARIKYQSGGMSNKGFIAASTETVKDSPNSDTTLMGIYLQDEISFDNSKWEIIPGIRFDYYNLDSKSDAQYLQSKKAAIAKDINENEFNPSLAILYKSSDNLTFYGKYNRGFRAPQYSEINSSFQNLAYRYYVVSNPDLKSEKSNNYEIGVNGTYDKLSFAFNGFWTNFTDRIDGIVKLPATHPLADPGYSVYQFQNKDKAEVYGFELNSNYNFNAKTNGFSLINSMAWTIGNDTSTSDYSPLTSIDPFKAIFGLRYDSESEKWSSEIIATHTGVAETSSTNTNFVPDSSTIIDAITNYKFNDQLSIDVGLYNIFDSKYFKYQTVKNERANAVDLDQFSEPGMNIKIGFKFIF